MELKIPHIDSLDATLSKQIRVEISLLLYKNGTYSMGQAASYAEMAYVDFQKLLGDRKIPMNYDISDLEADISTLNEVFGE